MTDKQYNHREDKPIEELFCAGHVCFRNSRCKNCIPDKENSLCSDYTPIVIRPYFVESLEAKESDLDSRTISSTDDRRVNPQQSQVVDYNEGSPADINDLDKRV